MSVSLKQLRESQGVTQEELAEIVGVGQSTISKFENQDDHRLSVLSRYVNALGGELVLDLTLHGRKISFMINPDGTWSNNA